MASEVPGGDVVPSSDDTNTQQGGTDKVLMTEQETKQSHNDIPEATAEQQAADQEIRRELTSAGADQGGPDIWDEELRDELFGYQSPMEDPYTRALKYLEKHQVMELFKGLTANIVYDRPADPLQFMLEKVEGMIKEREEKWAKEVETQKKEQEQGS
ncbi:testis-specific expressed protein 55-like [Branchiostoma floridae]|uniref:Testis-specific expressed protein 55-like n=1 Tax=Branchiostoma floridae TaxID=7739 RepID=C3XR38_BRAFL|nr:testis-specific expressed protein 55-like [Branchiostoma floridae]|eukprot:XP_002613147.1 hypothetical protein BRAFLDRAFT_120244 [Branchiostoma floridae]